MTESLPTIEVRLWNALGRTGRILQPSDPASLHRLLRNATIDLSEVRDRQGEFVVPTTPTPVASGSRRFEFRRRPPVVDLQVEVLETPAGAPVLTLQQRLEVNVFAPGFSALTHRGRVPEWPANAHLHPRVSFELRRANRWVIWVDVTFLNVSGMVATSTTPVPFYNHPGSQGANWFAGAPGFRPPQWRPAGDTSDHYEMETYLLEYTAGRPVAWAVLVPPRKPVLGETRRVGCLLFFQPASHQYSSWADASFFQVGRFWSDPPRNHPWHVVPVGANEFGVQPLACSTSSLGYAPVTHCGFARQLAEAHRALPPDHEAPVLVTPLPHGADYGALGGGETDHILDSLVRALWAEEAIQDRTRRVRRGRLGVAGFSFGCGPALRTFSRLRLRREEGRRVDELYLFDPNPGDWQRHAAAVLEWITYHPVDPSLHVPGRRLRFIVGLDLHLLLPVSQDLARRGLPPGNQQSILPDSHRFWFDNPLYGAAWSHPAHIRAPTPSPELHLTPSTQAIAPAGSVTERLRLWACEPRRREPPAALEFRPRRGAPRAVNVGEARREVAEILLHAFWTPNRGLPSIGTHVTMIRHQWPVYGGVDTTGDVDRGLTFKGHLQVCLEGSGF